LPALNAVPSGDIAIKPPDITSSAKHARVLMNGLNGQNSFAPDIWITARSGMPKIAREQHDWRLIR